MSKGKLNISAEIHDAGDTRLTIATLTMTMSDCRMKQKYLDETLEFDTMFRVLLRFKFR